MSFKSNVLATLAAVSFALPAVAEGIMVQEAYARASSPKSTSGAAFMMIMNHSGIDDRLIDVKSDIAARVELHTHSADANGVMKMLHVKEGFAAPAGEMLALQRGGKHVMLMGIKQPLLQDDHFPVTLVFENAGEVEVDVVVDLNRKPKMGGMDHSDMKMDDASN
jgi:copper(I)-binding protein